MPPGLHLDYDLDFQTRRVDDMALTLTSPLLSGLISNIRLLGRPKIPRKLVTFKVDEGLWGHGRAPAKPGAPGPSHDDGMVPKMQAGEGEAQENKLHDQGESDHDQPFFEPDPEEVAGVMISDDEEIDLTINMPQAASTPKVNQPSARSNPWRTGVHARHLQRNGQQKRKKRAHLNGKQLCLEG